VKTNSVLDLPKSGQPLKSSHGEKPNLLHFEKGPFFTANEVTENCNILKKVSVCIVCKHLYTVGFLEVGHRANYCYLCNIFEIGKIVQGIFGNVSGEENKNPDISSFNKIMQSYYNHFGKPIIIIYFGVNVEYKKIIDEDFLHHINQIFLV